MNPLKPIWIDTDISIGQEYSPGFYRDIDDGLAMISLFNSRKVAIRGVSTTFGNTDTDSSFRIATELVNRFGPDDLEVFHGANGPIKDPDNPPVSDGSEALAAALRKERLTVLSLGSATNIGVVIRKYPELVNQIDELVAMAGSRTSPKELFIVGPKQEKPFPAMNFEADVTAWHIILNSNVPITFVPFKCSHSIWLTEEDAKEVGKGAETGRYLEPYMERWAREWVREWGAPGFNPFDALASGYILVPDMFEVEVLPVSIKECHNYDEQALLEKLPLKKDYLLVSNEFEACRRVQWCSGVNQEFKPYLISSLQGGYNMSIIKASQAVSQLMVLDKLADELVDLARQNAGATKAVLLLKKDQTFVEVKYGTHTGQGKNMDQAPAEKSSFELPTMIIDYAIRAGENVVLDDAPSDNRFTRCDYIRTHAPKSVCCIPIIRQKEVHGVLYLENSEMCGAFHTDRLKVLKVIASQAAISLENIYIYQELDEMNKNLEQKLMVLTEELNKKNRELEILSTTDQLTGLFNKRSIDRTIKEEICRSHRYKAPLSLIMLDVDYFKQINNTHGHDVGDEVLVTMAALLNENTRSTDMVGRWGGEEFLVLVPQTNAEVCTLLAEKLCDVLSKHLHHRAGQITASFGVAEFGAGDSASSLIKHADQALYQAKNSGRNRVVVYEEP